MKGVYREYAKTGKRKGFYEEHRAELELFEAASKELREIFSEEKLPTIQELKQKKSELSKKKESQYELFKSLRSRWMELSKLVQNRDSLMQNMQIVSARIKQPQEQLITVFLGLYFCLTIYDTIGIICKS